MKKTLLSLAFLSIFSGSAVAQDDVNKNANEDILNNVLQQLMTKQDKEPKELIKDKEPKGLIKDKQDNIKRNPIVQNKVILKNKKSEEDKNKLTEIIEQPKMQLVEESVINDDVEKVLSTGIIIEDVNTSERELNIENDTPEHVFLLNVPIETKIRANVDLILPPYRDKISYYEGNVTSGSPFYYTSKATYCYLNLEKSGLWRRFKAEEDKHLKVISNVSNKKTYQYNADSSREVITVYETVFTFDNDHIKNLVCESSEKELPLTIKDLNKATGNLFSFEITPMLDI